MPTRPIHRIPDQAAGLSGGSVLAAIVQSLSTLQGAVKDLQETELESLGLVAQQTRELQQLRLQVFAVAWHLWPFLPHLLLTPILPSWSHRLPALQVPQASLLP